MKRVMLAPCLVLFAVLGCSSSSSDPTSSPNGGAPQAVLDAAAGAPGEESSGTSGSSPVLTGVSASAGSCTTDADCPAGSTCTATVREITTYACVASAAPVKAAADAGPPVPPAPPAAPDDAGVSCAPVNGGWSAWSNACSWDGQACQGTGTATRTCTSPAPACGGADCAGEDTMAVACGPQTFNICDASPNGESNCNALLASFRTSCAQSGACSWNSPASCTVGGSPSNSECWGATGSCQ